MDWKDVGWIPGTSDIGKQLLLKRISQILQIHPYQEQITFRSLYSKTKKKKFSVCQKFYFFLQKWPTFGERIPKRYNTWGQESDFRSERVVGVA